VNGDGKLDVAAVNGDSDSASILLGNGDGTLGAPTVFNTSGTEVSTVLGDLDGDGDLDWVISSFSGQQWHVFVNDGSGTFMLDADIDADPGANPSCAIMIDVDDDGDLDLALANETTDHLKILRNGGGPVSPCPRHWTRAANPSRLPPPRS
jgi:FG-GAP-like repeat